MAEEFPIDWNDVLERCAGDEDLVDVLTEAFFADNPQHLAALQQAITAGDAAQARSLAHTLKGSAAAIGAKPLSAASLAVEKAAAEGDLAAAGQGLETIRREFERLQAFLGEPDWKDRLKAVAVG